MTRQAAVTVEPVTPQRWGDVMDLFQRRGPRGGTPIARGCWCQYWHVRGKAYFRGWEGGNRERLEASRTLARVDDEPVWAVVCFYVHPSAKRQGVASALVVAAAAHTAEKGASILEAYAVRADHPNIDAYTGYSPMFQAAGFEPVRAAGRRTIMRRRL